MTPGQNISRYQILERVGEGGMGVVYKARDLRLDRFVCIKMLHPEKMKDQSRKQRFIQEAKSASSRNHPNIVTIHEIDQVKRGRLHGDGIHRRQNPAETDRSGAPVHAGSHHGLRSEEHTSELQS